MAKLKTVEELQGVTFPISGEGSTVTEAKRDLAERAKEACERLRYKPEIISIGKVSALVYADLYGYCYSVIEDRKLRGCHTSGNPTESETIRNCISNLAQMAWEPTMNDTDTMDIARQIDHDGDRAEFLRWTQWQRRYASLRAAGHSETEAHRLAFSS